MGWTLAIHFVFYFYFNQILPWTIMLVEINTPNYFFSQFSHRMQMRWGSQSRCLRLTSLALPTWTMSSHLKRKEWIWSDQCNWGCWLLEWWFWFQWAWSVPSIRRHFLGCGGHSLQQLFALLENAKASSVTITLIPRSSSSKSISTRICSSSSSLSLPYLMSPSSTSIVHSRLRRMSMLELENWRNVITVEEEQKKRQRWRRRRI